MLYIKYHYLRDSRFRSPDYVLDAPEQGGVLDSYRGWC